MNLRSWRYFLKVAELRNIAAAARELRMAQPALSRHIAAVEAEFGQSLFFRHRRGVSLTEAGALMRERAVSILGAVDRLYDDLNARATEPSGALAIGMPPSLSWAVAAPLFTRFRRDFPSVKVRFQEAPTEDLLTGLERGNLDGVVTVVCEPIRHFQTSLIATDYIGLFAPAKAKIDPDGVHARDLAGLPLVLMTGTRFIADRFDYAASRAGISLNYVMETNSLLQLQLAEAGVAYSMLPMCVVASPHFSRIGRKLKGAPILDLPIEWGFATAHDRPRSAALNAFEDALKFEVGSLIKTGKWPWGTMHPRASPKSKSGK
jgi:LysR family transcriptional regulator, nitrogen assimilation regulatory protein